MKRFVPLLLVITLGLALIGCSTSKKFVGKWNVNVGLFSSQIEIRSDGTAIGGGSETLKWRQIDMDNIEFTEGSLKGSKIRMSSDPNKATLLGTSGMSAEITRFE